MASNIIDKLPLLLVLGFVLTGCVAPKTFVKTMEPTWASVELRTDVVYDQAWEAIVDTLVKRFDIEIMSRQDGYIRTNWLYTWTGKVQENYRVRVTAKFAPDRKKLEVKSEAEYGGPGMWVMGYDTRLLETIKTDVMGTIGRTTREGGGMTRLSLVAFLLSCLCGCSTPRIPKSFSQVTSPGWAAIEIRDGVNDDHAWRMVLGILVRDFDIEYANKEDGYIRTAWSHTWSGVHQLNYRVRVTVIFSEDRKTIDVKSEAQALKGSNWSMGVDSRQLATLKTDLMGTIGRITR